MFTSIHATNQLARIVPRRPAGLIVAIRAYSTSLPLSRDPRVRQHITSEARITHPNNATYPDLPLRSPWVLDTAYSIFAKRQTRPFPPPFTSNPSGSFSDPLTTHQGASFRFPKVDGQLLRGITNGDDAIIIDGQNFLAVNDGVGAWAQKERGHAALWSRLIAHYWAAELEKLFQAGEPGKQVDVGIDQIKPIELLEQAYMKTKEATNFGLENAIMGTTTASSVLLHHTAQDEPVILATTLGDCATLIVRPSTSEILYRSVEQWHWFDCPRQLGTNSPDTPLGNAVCDSISVQEGDVVLCMSDGVSDNLWEEEICEKTCQAIKLWRDNVKEAEDGPLYLARMLQDSAREIAMDPNAGSPYMERAIDEGLAAEGGKLDDISVLVGIVKRLKSDDDTK